MATREGETMWEGGMVASPSLRIFPPLPRLLYGQGHSSRLESLYTLSLYDELSAAVPGGVGELRLMTLPPPSSPAAHLLQSYYL